MSVGSDNQLTSEVEESEEKRHLHERGFLLRVTSYIENCKRSNDVLPVI